MMFRIFTLSMPLFLILALYVSVWCISEVSPDIIDPYSIQAGDDIIDKVNRTDEEWRQILTLRQYEVTRKKCTETPFTGELYDFQGQGTYMCVCCGNELFSSEEKFDSGAGWPSFTAPISGKSVQTALHTSHGMERREVMCRRCDAHLGHVFADGPLPTGLRYCINSIALEFMETEK